MYNLMVFGFASQASIGIIFRCSLNYWQMIKWNTNTDEFEEGQWIYAALDMESIDVSSDGEFILYNELIKKTKHICKAPYWYDLATFQSSTGRLISTVSLPKKQGLFHRIFSPLIGLLSSDRISYPKIDIDLTPRNRLGWKYMIWGGSWSVSGDGIVTRLPKGHRYNPYAAYTTRKVKSNPLKTHIIMEIANREDRRYCYGKISDETYISLDSVTCVDWDQRGRLIYGLEGDLYAIEFTNNTQNIIKLSDFSKNHYSEIDTPEWAKRW